jgi:hypothetical protein
MWAAGATGTEIARHSGISRQRVSQVIRRASGPSASEVREVRSAQQREATQRLAADVRAFVETNPGTTLEEMASELGLPVSDVSSIPDDVRRFVVVRRQAKGVQLE